MGWIAVLAGFVACTPTRMSLDDNESPSPVADSGLSARDPSSPSTDAPPPSSAEPRFQAHAIELLVDDLGEVDIDSSTWTWTLADDKGLVSCSTPLTILEVMAVEPPDTEPVTLASWQLVVEGGDALPCVLAEPIELGVGIAAPDVRLTPALANGDGDVAERYSYTLQRGATGVITLHGSASTADIRDGLAPLATEPPLPADRYALEPLLYLNLE